MRVTLTLVYLAIIVAASATAIPPYGVGTESNPYQISSLGNLQWMSENQYQWGRWYIQVADIDASATSTWNNGQGWSPIGNSTYYFYGHYLGQGHTITGLYIHRPESNNQGFIGFTMFAEISDLNLVDAIISGEDRIGILTGYCNSTIRNCHTEGVVQGDSFVGGLAGSFLSDYSMTDCFSNAFVDGERYVGGLVGQNSGTVSDSYARGNVRGYSAVGGCVGRQEGTILNCYSTGHVTGSSSTGGLTGSNSGTATGCFWNTETSGQAASSGGTGLTTEQMQADSTFVNAGWDFVNHWAMESATNDGYPFLNWPIIPDFYTFNPSSVDFGAVAFGEVDTLMVSITNNWPAGLSVDNMILQSGSQGFTIAGQDFPIAIATGESYNFNIYFDPSDGVDFCDTLVVSWVAPLEPVEIVITGECQYLAYGAPVLGAGTGVDPFQIDNLSKLKWLQSLPVLWNKWFIQTADIDASETATWNENTGWMPIGNTDTSFSGNFDGQGYSISNLYINRPTSYYQGLFGMTYYAEISRVNLPDVYVRGNANTSALASQCGFSIITDCSASGTVYSSYITVGGMVSYLYNGTVDHCRFNGVVHGLNSTGGIVGRSFDSEVRYCNSAGSVSGHRDVGGVVGYNNNRVYLCFSTADVSGYEDVGGLIGYHVSESSLCVSDCFVTGDVTGTNYAGGLIGYSASSIPDGVTRCFSSGYVTGQNSPGGLTGYASSDSWTSCFWNTETSGWSFGGEGDPGTGLTTAQMRDQSIFTDAGWDFIGETGNGTNDYWGMGSFPYLIVVGDRAVIRNEVPEIDFGNHYLGQAASTMPLTIHNDGDAVLVITQFSFADGSLGFGIETETPLSILPFESQEITLSFQPMNSGTLTDLLQIESNNYSSAIFEVSLTGYGIPVGPLAPQNIHIQKSGNDVNLSWSPVTENTDGVSIVPTGYIVLYSVIPDAATDDYIFLGLTTDLTFTHANVTLSNASMFYKVLTCVGAPPQISTQNNDANESESAR